MLARVFHKFRLDIVFGTTLFVMAFAVASWYVPYFVRSGGKPWFYQEQFGPAVMEACGRGYVNPDLSAVAPMRDFLSRQTDTFDCNQIGTPPILSLASMQKAFRYLMMTVSGVWVVERQVSWSGLTPFYSLIYGITTVLAYAVLRQGMGPWLAGVGGLAIALSTLHLNNLPHLRDYGKAPFVLAIVLVAMRLVKGPATRRRVLKYAVIGGVLSGVGIGFRNDLLVAIPAMLAVIALFLPVAPLAAIGLRLSAVGVYVATTLVAMMPMWSIYTTGGGSSTQHLVLLGLADEFTEELGIDNSRLYHWVYDYRDELAQVMISDFANRRLGHPEILKMYSAEYDRAGGELLKEIASEFPADMLVRVYASALNVMELPYSATTTALMPPAFVTEPLLKFSRARTWVLRRLTPLWPWFYAISLVALTIHSRRLGLFALVFVVYVSGYPALQFQERHIFHLEFIGWWVLGFSLQVTWPAVRAVVSRERREAWLPSVRPAAGWRRAIVATAALAATTAVVLAAPLWFLRSYQQQHLRSTLQAVVDAPRRPLDTNRVPLPGGMVRLELLSLGGAADSDDAVHAEYVVAEFGGGKCETLKLDMTYRYVATESPFDFSRTVRVQPPLSDRPVQVYLPMYFRRPWAERSVKEGFRFTGIELPESTVDCLTSLTAIEHPERFPVLADLHLRPNWESATLYGTIRGVEGRVPPDEFPDVYTFPPDLSVRRSLLMTEPAPFRKEDITKVSSTFSMEPSGWTVAGVGGVGGRGPFLYLVEFGARPLKEGSYVIAQGRVEKGGLSFGIVEGDNWIAQVPVIQPGPFAVVVKVPHDANYKIVLANNLRGTSLDNRLVVSRAGVIPPDAKP